MSVGLFLVGAFGLLLLPGVTYRRSLALRPSDEARLDALTLVLGTGLLESALILCALPTVSASVFGSPTGSHFFPGGAVAGWISAALAVATPAGCAMGISRVLRRRRRLRAEPWVGDHYWCNDTEVVVLPTDDHVAIALPGHSPQVIVSRGVVTDLTNEELRAVILHELAHVSYHHSRYLLIAGALHPVLGWFAPLRRSIDAMELAIECWADDVASATPEARTATRGAVLALATLEPGHGIAAFSAEEQIAHRLDALGRAHGSGSWPTRLSLYAASAVLFAIGLLSLASRLI